MSDVVIVFRCTHSVWIAESIWDLLQEEWERKGTKGECVSVKSVYTEKKAKKKQKRSRRNTPSKQQLFIIHESNRISLSGSYKRSNSLRQERKSMEKLQGKVPNWDRRLTADQKDLKISIKIYIHIRDKDYQNIDIR